DTSIRPALPLVDFAASALPTSADSVSTQQDSIDTVLDRSFVVSVSANKDTANGDFSYEWMSDYWSGGIGVAFVDSDHTYLGFNGGARVHFPWIISPFVGLGFYGGDSKTCTYEDLGYGYKAETCEKYFLMALTADLGLQLSLNNHARLRLFTRGFNQTRQGDPLGATLYGMSFALLF
ncbi:MAG: hypothetical protein IT287_00645, partial [Bdellovibrionaceae bacterium]|nr:hypothetical protein [Pseudobdellovibrionaceae bacterium]